MLFDVGTRVERFEKTFAGIGAVWRVSKLHFECEGDEKPLLNRSNKSKCYERNPKPMTDFVLNSQTKTAVRELAGPIADVTAFNLILKLVITDNPFAY